MGPRMSRISVLWRPLGPSFPASGLLHGPFPRPTVLAALAGDESGQNGRDLRTAARCVRARQATDSDFNSRYAFEPGRQPSFCQHTTRLSVRSSRVMAQSGRLVLRSGQLTCPETLRTRLRRQGMRELGRLWAIGESPRPDRRVRVAKMWLGASKTATDDHL